MLRSFWQYLDGRKTYLVSGALLLAVLVLVFMGHLEPSVSVSLVAVAGFAFSFRSAIQKHHSQVLAVLTDIATAGVAYREHNKKALTAAANSAVRDGKTLADEIHAEKGS